MNKFDKPFRILPIFDQKKSIELFNLVSKLDTHEILQFSLINQVPLDVINGIGDSLIHEVINIDSKKASEHAKLNVIKFLVLHNVNPDRPNQNNQTPFHYACSLQLPLIVEYLLGLKVDVNFKDNMGNTPFHYLLTGKIKTIYNTSNVMEFVPPPKKVDTKLRDDTIELKKVVWELIEEKTKSSTKIKTGLPVLETIQNTIDNLLIEEPEIVERQIITENLVVKLASQSGLESKLSEIQQNVEANRKFIADKIKKLMGDLKDLPNLRIHSRVGTSWSPLNTSEGLIVDGKIKTVIKNEIIKQEDFVNKLDNDFTLIDTMSNDWNNNGWDELVIKYYFAEIGLDKFKKIGATDNYNFNGVPMLDQFNNLHNNFKHPLALDYASSIIDFKKLKYVGGPRNVQIEYPALVKDELVELLDTGKFEDEFQQILYLLGSPLNQTTIKTFGTDYDLLTNIGAFDSIGDFGTQANWFTTTAPSAQLQYDMKFYVILAYIAIKRSDEFLRISSIKLGSLDFSINKYAKKWYQIYNSTPDLNLGSWLIGMWTDLMCKFSDSNLDCKIPFRLLALAGGLNNYQTNKIQGVINVYKPILTELIFNLSSIDSNEVKLTKWILFLLNDSVDKAFVDAIFTIQTDIKFVDTLAITQNLKSLVKVLYKYIGSPTLFTPNITIADADEQFYLSYVKSKEPKDNFCRIILELYKNLKNQPLNQTILDTIYWIKMINISNIKSINNFYFINTQNLYKDLVSKKSTKTIDTSKNLSPSSYSFMNLLNAQSIIKKPNNLAENHFNIAHILGLYFEGCFFPVNYKLNNYISFQDVKTKTKTNYNISFSKIDTGSNKPYPSHKMLVLGTVQDSLAIDNIELPLNYVNLDGTAATNNENDLTSGSKYQYYNINGRDYISPTIHSYAHMLLDTIKQLQDLLKPLVKRANNIITELIGSRTTGLKDLFTKIYYEIMFLSKKLSYFTNSFADFTKSMDKNELWNYLEISKNKTYKRINNFNYTELARSLNKINSSYYLYYYIFTPDNLVKLSRFNYYQIPINSPTGFEYYEGPAPSQMIDIDKDTDLVSATGSTLTILTDSEKGLINQFSLGAYSVMLSEYFNGVLPTVNKIKAADFISEKKVQVPPSLYNYMDDFYKYTLIELIEKLVEDIESLKTITSSVQEKIWTKSENIIKSRGLSIKDNNLTTHLFIAKIIQELIKEQIDVYITNATADKFKQFITGNSSKPPLVNSIIFKNKLMDVNLKSTSIDVSTVTLGEIKNMYSMVISPIKNDKVFILYPNDLTNINKLRSKYGVEVNKDIIKLMFKHGASPFASSNDGTTPIYPIIKNYNWVIIEILKKEYNIDFRDFYGELPIKFIQRENLNNLGKILDTYKQIDPIKKLFTNIDGFLFDDVKSLITSNESFGNNILSNLSESFNMSSYLTFQLLSENLINIGLDFSFDNLIDLLKINNIKITNLKNNYWKEVIGSFDIPQNFDEIIGQKLIEEKTSEKKELEKEFEALKETAEKLKKYLKTDTLGSDLESEPKYKKFDTNIKNLDLQISHLKRLKTTKYLSSGNLPSDPKIINLIDRYNDKVIFSDYGVLLKVWETMLSKSINNGLTYNYNLIPVYVLEKQKEFIENFTASSKINLELIEKTMGHWAKFGEYYFSNPKYIEQNIGTEFVNKMLNYLTKIVIGNGIELMMRRVLLSYLQNTSTDLSLSDINIRIKYWLEDDFDGITGLDGKPTSLLNYLYNEVCPKFVKNSAELYTDKSDEQGFIAQSTKEILLGFFSFLDVFGLPDDVKTVFNKEVTNYFDTIIGKTILLWYVNFENILKFFINNHRCLKTLLLLA
jgi:hypothetical protein